MSTARGSGTPAKKVVNRSTFIIFLVIMIILLLIFMALAIAFYFLYRRTLANSQNKICPVIPT